MSEISIHSAFSNFQHYIMDFFLALSYILYWDFSYIFQYVYLGIFPILVYIYMGVFMFSSQSSRWFFSSFLLYSFLYIHFDKCCTNKSNSHRKTIKWYKKFFFHIVDMASVNGLYLYKTQNSKKNLQLKEFRL